MEQAEGTNPSRERISALADCELDPLQAQAAIEELLASDGARAFWGELHTGGDLLRSDEALGAVDGAGFVERLSRRLAMEPVHLAPRAAEDTRARGWLRYGLPSASIAAAVAMVLWMAIPQMIKPAADVAALTGAQVSKDALVELAAQPAAAPVGTRVAMDPDQVGEYLTAHQGSVQAASLTIVSNKAESRP